MLLHSLSAIAVSIVVSKLEVMNNTRQCNHSNDTVRLINITLNPSGLHQLHQHDLGINKIIEDEKQAHKLEHNGKFLPH